MRRQRECVVEAEALWLTEVTGVDISLRTGVVKKIR